MHFRAIATVALGLLATTIQAAPGGRIKHKCCAVWSTYQKSCLEMAPDNWDGCDVEGWHSKPVGEYAVPDDCAIWRIHPHTKCLVKKKGYPGKYVNGEGIMVDGGQMH